MSQKTKKTKYLTNKELLAEVIKSREADQMSNKMAEMLQLLTRRYGRKGNFANYTFNEDMQAYAMFMLVRTWKSFDPERSSNPFAFFTQCIKNSFIQFLNQEKRQRVIRDELLLEQGLNPSFAYTASVESNPHDNRDFAEDEQDFEQIQVQAKQLEQEERNPEEQE